MVRLGPLLLPDGVRILMIFSKFLGSISPPKLSLLLTKRPFVLLVPQTSVVEERVEAHTALPVVTVTSTERRSPHLESTGHNLLVSDGELPGSKFAIPSTTLLCVGLAGWCLLGSRLGCERLQSWGDLSTSRSTEKGDTQLYGTWYMIINLWLRLLPSSRPCCVSLQNCSMSISSLSSSTSRLLYAMLHYYKTLKTREITCVVRACSFTRRCLQYFLVRFLLSVWLCDPLFAL